MTILTTERLRLEPYQDRHLEGLFRLNSDPAVMRYITGKPLSLEETEQTLAKIKQRWNDFGFSWWAFIELSSNEVIGAGCIQHLAQARENPLEVGWRLRPDKWHQGFATEAARAMLEFAFSTLNAPLLYAVCHTENPASAKVMERLGMQYRGIERWYDMDTLAYQLSFEQFQLTKARAAKS